MQLSNFYLLSVILISYIGTYLMILVSRRMGLIDQPNSRSSHATPTARGAGVAVVLAVILGSIGAWIFEDISGFKRSLFPVMVVGGLLVAIIGWIDDLKSLSARIRLTTHIFAAGLFSAVLFSDLFLNPETRWSGIFLFLILTLALSWMVNLTNFMDGLNGILGIQTLTVSLSGAILASRTNDMWVSALFMVLVLASSGFLPWNWNKAKIFMGDVGSGFLGFWIGAVFTIAILRESLSLPEAMILNSVFLVDTAYTLVSRALQGKNPAQAHRTHAYQKLNQKGWSHSRVSLVVGVFNLTVLLPLTYFGTPLLVSAVLPLSLLIYACVKLRAGHEI